MNLIRKCINFFLINLRKLINAALAKFNLIILYRDGEAIGDQIMITAAIKSLYEDYNFKIIILSSYPDIFIHNKKIMWLIDIKKNRTIFRVIRFLSGSNIIYFGYSQHEKIVDYMRGNKNPGHLVDIYSKRIPFNLKKDKFYKNEIFFSDKEKGLFSKKFQLPSNFVVINPISKSTFTKNKDWGYSNFSELVRLRNDKVWVQVGLKSDKLISNCIDLRGKTNLRELFYVISRSSFVIANEGIINHIAGAFDVKSYIIQTGFSDSSMVEYKNSVFFDDKVSCDFAPCWKLVKCDIKNKPCVAMLTPEFIASKIK